MPNYLLTSSLLSSWQWYMGNAEDKKALEDFQRTLSREPFKPNEAMQAGIDFEAAVMEHLKTVSLAVELAQPDDDYARCVAEVGETVRGASFQVKAKRLLSVNGRTYLMYGRIDAMKGDAMYDIKFTGSPYEIGKYLTIPQHRMYFYIVPEVDRFIYLTSNGSLVWTEEYRREDCVSIQEEAADFNTWMESYPEFKAAYEKNWKSF